MIDINKIYLERFNPDEEYLGLNKAVNSLKPKVSICVATYNHCKYIEKCIYSILNQKVDFDYEIIIGEDGSNDGTRDICKELAKNNPDRIRLFLRDRDTSQLIVDGKLITRFNGKWNRLSARGEYIALCEGDDYWVDDNKLQKQVDYLDENSGFSGVFTNYSTIDPNGNLLESEAWGMNKKKDLGTLDLLSGYVPRILTVLFRSDLAPKEFPNELYASKNPDRVLFLILSKSKPMKYLDFISGAYRKHDGGIWTSLTSEKKFQQQIESAKLFKNYFTNKAEQNAIRRRVLTSAKKLAKLNFRNRKWVAGSRYYIEAVINKCSIVFYELLK